MRCTDAQRALQEVPARGRPRVEVDDLDGEAARLAAHGVEFQGPLDPAPVHAPVTMRGRGHLWTRPGTSGGFMLQLVEAAPPAEG